MGKEYAWKEGFICVQILLSLNFQLKREVLMLLCCAKDRFSEDTDFNQFQCIWDVTIVNRDPLNSVIQFTQVHRPEQNHAMLLLIRITTISSVKCLAFEAFVHLSQVTFVCLMKHRCERGRFRKTAFHRQELSPKFQGRGILRFFHDLKNINHSRGNHI